MKKSIPTSIWALGFVSLFMDMSSELIHSLLPIFLATTLGASMTAIGFVEGIAEATALIVKIFSGTLSDYFQKRKLLTVIGYGVAAQLRGTAYGVFNLICGIATLISSITAGILWDYFGASMTFFAGATLTGFAFIGVIKYGYKYDKRQ